MRKTKACEKINELKAKAAKLVREAATLAKIRRMKPGAKERLQEAIRLEGKVKDLKPKARLEDLATLISQTKGAVLGPGILEKLFFPQS